MSAQPLHVRVTSEQDYDEEYQLSQSQIDFNAVRYPLLYDENNNTSNNNNNNNKDPKEKNFGM